MNNVGQAGFTLFRSQHQHIQVCGSVGVVIMISTIGPVSLLYAPFLVPLDLPLDYVCMYLLALRGWELQSFLTHILQS